MSDPNAHVPLRQLTRLRAEMAMMSAERMAVLFPDHPLLGIEFGILMRFCLRDWTLGGALARPDTIVRTITVRQIASSLGVAAETTRRRVHELRDLGIVVTLPAGVALAPTPENEGRVVHYCTYVHDLFVRLIEDVGLTCDVEWPVNAADTVTFEDIVERSIDTLLLTIDTFRLPGSRSAFLLWAALTAVAVRGVTYDPVLARRFADDIPTDDLRKAVSLHRFAEALSVPYATAWRQIQALREAGLVTRPSKDQWTVLTANLQQQHVRDLSTKPSLALYRRIRELALLGLDPARAGERYLGDRPVIADLGLPNAS